MCATHFERRVLQLATLAGSSGTRGVAMVGSVALHAVLLFTALGHPTSVRADGAVQTVDVDLTLTQAPLADLATPEEAPHTRQSPASPQHTHAYPVPPSHDWTPHDPNLVHVFSPAPSLAPAAPPVASSPALTSDDEMPHFTVVGGAGDAVAQGPVAPGATEQGYKGEDGAPVPEQHVTSRAHLASGGAPTYPESARADGIEADVALELVVSPAGTVETARVLGPAGHGLDQAALDAVRTYRFAPATKDGHPVRVRMQWLVQFRLR